MIKAITGKLKASLFPLYSRYWKLKYKGNAYECTICSYSAGAFMPFGVVKRKNAMCPNCYSLERHRLQWLYLAKKTNLLTTPLSLLHFAPESTLRKKLEVMKHIKYVTADIAIYDKAIMMKVDVTNMPFKDKKNGWAILQTPIDMKRAKTYEDPTIIRPLDRLKVFGQSDHVRLYGKDYKKILTSAGFKVKEDNFVNTLSPLQARKYALDNSELIYFCKK